MVKKLRGLAPLLVIVIGLLVLFYPTISNFLVMKNASRVVSNYDAAVEALSDEEYRSMIDAAHAYNTRLAEESSGTTSALTGAVNTEATDAEYMKLLNLAGDGMMGYITRRPCLFITALPRKYCNPASVTWNRPHYQLVARPLMRRCLATEGCPRQNCSRT